MAKNNELIRLAKKAADAWRNTDAYYQAAQIIDMLVEELESNTLTQPNEGAKDKNVPTNEPLTLEQLREMDGEPVYVVPKDKPAHCGGWCGVTVWKCDRYSYVSLLRDADSGWGFEKYSKTWIAYRRPPEGGNDVS